MFDLHIFSRFLRLVRSIRRSLLALFVAIAMLLATFVIAPAYALSANQNGGGRTNTEQTEGAKVDGAGGAKSDAVQKQSVQQSEPNKTESDKKNTDTSSTLNKDNKELKPDSKQKPDSNKADNKADNNAKSTDKTKSDDKTKSADKTGKTVEKSAANKNGKNKVASTETARRMNRSVRKPKECNRLGECYRVSYTDDGKILIKRGETRPITPEFKLRPRKNPTFKLNGLWFKLEKDGEDPVPSWANFEKDNGATKVKDTSKDKTGFDGSVTLRPGKWDRGDHKFKIGIYRTDQDKKIVDISVKIDESDISKNDLSLSLYDFGKENDKVSVSNDKITIKPKSKGAAPAVGTAGSDDNKDVYDPINKLFIDSQSAKEPGYIHHHMICHKKTSTNGSAETSDSADSYTLDSVNGLSLSDKDGSTTEKQTQFTHKDQTKPSTGAGAYAVYEKGDDITERSQSWITGKPKDDGTFECKVFAIKDTKLVSSGGGKHFESSTVSDEFNKKVKDNDGMQSLFDKPEQNIVEDKWENKASITKGIDWDYKSVTIEVKSSEPQKPTIGKNDLTLKVYTFKNSDGSLPAPLSSSNNDIYAMLGMELKPFIDAISAADSANQITLRVLCSKGEKKDSGSQSAQSSGSSQPAQPSESTQDAKDLEYKTWSSNLADLGLSVPADDNQNTCHSNKEGETTCASADPSKKVAARTDTEVSIKPSLKPTAVGDYQCVVFALKPKALDAFNDAISKATQSGSLTPTSISSALTTATPKAFKEHMDFAAFTLNIHLSSKFTLPHTGGQSWNLQLGILAALLVNLLAAGFVVSQSERARKLIFGRRRGLCNYV